jgi:meiotically up-regulated gene 157 (Mug157) protein
MIRYIGFAVFACICFLGGYFTGQWTTFRNPAADSFLTQQAVFLARAYEIERYGYSAETLKLIKSINTENHAQFEAAYSEQVKQNISTLEAMQADKSLKPYNLIIQTQLKRLKSIAENGNGS